MIVSNNNNEDQNKEDKRFTIQYTKEELNKIQYDFLQQISEYIARVNNRHIIKTIVEEIEQENEVELFPPVIIDERKRL
jgi:hypothetical protein